MAVRDDGSDEASPSSTRVLFSPEDIGRADPNDIATALMKLFQQGPCSNLARVLVDRRWFKFILTLKGDQAQIVIDRLQFVRIYDLHSYSSLSADSLPVR